MRHTVLLSTIGAEPQVVTLTLDALLARGEQIDRVVVIHTADHEEPIRSSLQQLHREFIELQTYGTQLLYMPQVLTSPSGPLSDVATAEEIEFAFQSFYTLLRQYKQAGSTVHLCIAGGRKTMSLFAVAAAQILFTAEDQVWHLVSTPALVRSKKLHADQPHEVILVPVPMVRWGRMRADDRSHAQSFLENALTPAEREVTILLVREGLSNAQLALRLGKSIKTIANQLSSIYEKLRQHYSLAETPDRTLLLVLLGSYS